MHSAGLKSPLMLAVLALALLALLAGTARTQSEEKGQEKKPKVGTRAVTTPPVQDVLVDLGWGADYGWETVSGGGISFSRPDPPTTAAPSLIIDDLTFSGPAVERDYLANWLKEYVEYSGTEKGVIVWATKPDGTAYTTTGYEGCVPVRYVFPKFEWGVNCYQAEYPYESGSEARLKVLTQAQRTESLVVRPQFMQEGTLQVVSALEAPASSTTEQPAAETTAETEQPATEATTETTTTTTDSLRDRLLTRSVVAPRSTPNPVMQFRVDVSGAGGGGNVTDQLRALDIGDLNFDWDVVQITTSTGVQDRIQFAGYRCGDITIRLKAKSQPSALAAWADAVAKGTDAKWTITLQLYVGVDLSYQEGCRFEFQDCQLLRWSPREHDPSNTQDPVMESYVIRVGKLEITP